MKAIKLSEITISKKGKKLASFYKLCKGIIFTMNYCSTDSGGFRTIQSYGKGLS